MACGEAVELDAVGPGAVQQQAELDLPVAADAGVGGAAGQVLLAEVLQDLGLIFGGQGDHMVGDAQAAGDVAGGLDVLVLAGPEAAGSAGGLEGDRAVPGLHGQADDVMSLLLQQVGRHGGIDAAAQADGYGLY